MKKLLSRFLLTTIVLFGAGLILAEVAEAQVTTGDPAQRRVNIPKPPPPRPMRTESTMDRMDSTERIGESRYVDNRMRPLDAIRREIKEKLKISDDQKDNFRRLVGDKKARVARVMAAYSCSSSLVLDVSDPRCLENPDLQIVSYYSFRFKDYGEAPWTDVAFVEDDIVAGNKWHTTGMIVDLGTEADFVKLDEKSAEATSLWNFQEAENAEDKTQQKVDLESGIKSGQFVFRSKLKVQPNHTYMVRTISYRPGRGLYAGFTWHNTDSIFVFKVMEVKEDRTMTLVWKKLLQKVAPVLETKRERSAKR